MGMDVSLNVSNPSFQACVGASVDSVEEFKVQSKPFAEFGRTGGGVINVVIKSGTNDFHGGVLLNFRATAAGCERLLRQPAGHPADQLQA
jgi:hypothetical protein